MNWQNLIALAIFVGVCGFIAYAGDLLGRRMGKRRLTLFGLRPRYTAIMTTTVTGMLIAVFTIIIMAMASTQVRELVLRGAEIYREYQAAQESYAKVSRELDRQKRVTDDAREEANTAVGQRNKLSSEIERITKNLNKLQANLHKREAALAVAEKNLTASSKEIAIRRKEIAKQKTDIDSLEKQRERIANLYFTEMGEATAKYMAVRQIPVIFRPNQEIARKVIHCAQSKLEIRSEVLALLNEADKRARDEGAKNGDNGRAVEILPKKIVTDRSGKGRFLKESESIDALVDNIYSGSGSVVARVISVGNSVEGEQALVEFALRYNKLVYSVEDEVASIVIDGSASSGQIFGNLIAFLRNEVRTSAEYQGIIPLYDEQGNPSVGQIAWDQLFDLVDRIKTIGKPVRVKAFAADETWSAGPLTLDLIVSDSL